MIDFVWVWSWHEPCTVGHCEHSSSFALCTCAGSHEDSCLEVPFQGISKWCQGFLHKDCAQHGSFIMLQLIGIKHSHGISGEHGTLC